MQLEYDLSIGALYIRLSDGGVARTDEVDDNTNVDLDPAGEVVGIEVICYTQPWPLAGILESYKIPAAERTQLDVYFREPLAPLRQPSSPLHRDQQFGAAPPAPARILEPA
jgi:uncharacterized protein YuzE